MARGALQPVSDPDLLDGVARGKFSHDTDMIDPLRPEVFADPPDFFVIDRRRFQPPVVDIPGNETAISPHGKPRRLDPRAAGQNHAHTVGFFLDNGVRGYGRAEHHAAELPGIFIAQEFLRDLQEGLQQVVRVGEDLGLSDDFEILDQNCVRMRPAYVYAQDHDTTPSAGNIFFDTGALYPDKFILTRQKKSVFLHVKQGDGYLRPLVKILERR
jgi:hypothetical protein